MRSNDLKELVSAVHRHLGDDGSYDTPECGIALFRSSAPTNHNAVVYVPSLCFIAQGAKEVVVGGQAYRYTPAQSLLVSVDLPATTRVVEASAQRPCLAIRVEIDAAIVGELLAEGTTVPSPADSTRGIAVTPTEPMLVDAVTRLVALLDTPRDIGALAPLVRREITYRLLTGPQGARLRQIVAPGAPAQRIARAIGWLKDHYAEPARVEAVAKHAGLSPSALHLHFKAVTGLSPLQYQKQFRLQEARRLMLSSGLDAAEAAFRVGYESPSQFGREYRRLFGSPPRQDVTALATAQPAGQSGV